MIFLPSVKVIVCYLLQSTTIPSRTYIGYSVNVQRRIRKHNGELAGGAKCTTTGRPWRIVAWVGPFEDNRTAEKFEWAWKNAHCANLFKPYIHETLGRPVGVEARLNVLQHLRLFFQRYAESTCHVK